MTKDEFLKRIEKEIPNIDDWDMIIETDEFVPGSYILGCYYNEKDRIWNVYQTTERGDEYVIFTASNEEEAYDKLYELVMFHKRLNDEYDDDDDYYDDDEDDKENK